MAIMMKVCYVACVVILGVTAVLFLQYVDALYPSKTTALRISNNWFLFSTFTGIVLMCFHCLCRIVVPSTQEAKE
jgi:TRAP-type C4-dicarboxylate transport system permease small subunit